jgi:hypothetical protein
MKQEATQLLELLEQERDAARRADVERLIELQSLKQEALIRLESIDLPDSVRIRLVDTARSNIDLMRHLAQCLHGLLTCDAPNLYNASGAKAVGGPARIRGSV